MTDGALWLAGGVRAVSFELVEITALAMVQFGSEFRIGLYGTAGAQFPKKPKRPWGKLSIDIAADYRSRDDVLEINAILAKDFFLVGPMCRASGETRFWGWFGRSARPGDFVRTVGGYHRSLDEGRKPVHSPSARRVGFDRARRARPRSCHSRSRPPDQRRGRITARRTTAPPDPCVAGVLRQPPTSVSNDGFHCLEQHEISTDVHCGGNSVPNQCSTLIGGSRRWSFPRLWWVRR
ncbi:hypothetical protein CEP50_02255 [Actinopolyspora mortivallis]|uniref:DUF6603 domain-containing protein n=1 Tax=Actinopolyspora mortivallis TaxID=33906 RepID=A0A2T0H1V5_ACTMO|nr:hypothetical protein CEP50_02255 [Actinopolyspora mortivallis]